MTREDPDRTSARTFRESFVQVWPAATPGHVLLLVRRPGGPGQGAEIPVDEARALAEELREHAAAASR